MSSYAISERVNAQVILWAMGGAIYSAAMAIRSILPHLLFALVLLAKALGLTAIVCGAIVVVAMIPLTFWLGMGIIAVLAYATYPRKAVRK